ncbi:MAG TPA: DUF1579 domain-containing protein [Lacipirellulaceae bacterium]|nr:DUF1579 domain-containing protein [Lacipirellulaceae bacterium]
MNSKKLLVSVLVFSLTIAAIVSSRAVADKSDDSKSATQPEMKLPPGWTADDMKACMLAGTPGKMQQLLTKDAGEWEGKSTMWMGPGGEPITSECTSTVTPILDGHYVKIEMKGDMPGMGPYHGGGVYGYDNVSKKFVAAWIDNHSTGIMHGEGELSPDQKTLTWTMTFNCPINKKPAVMTEVDKTTGPDSKTLEMFGDDPKTGKHYKMMRIELTKK